jgi:hypothetical protein
MGQPHAKSVETGVSLKRERKRQVATTTFIPDPFINWLMRWSIRTIAALIAIGIIAFIASIVFRAVALMVDTLHGALHSGLLLWMSIVHVYNQTGFIGQWLLICAISAGLLFIIYRGGLFLYQSFRGGIAS